MAAIPEYSAWDEFADLCSHLYYDPEFSEMQDLNANLITGQMYTDTLIIPKPRVFTTVDQRCVCAESRQCASAEMLLVEFG